MGVCAPECWCPLRPKASNPPEARVKDAREPPSVGGLAITPGSCVSPLFTAEATFSLFYFSSFELNSNIEWLFFHHHFAFLKVKSIEFSCFLERPFFSIRKKMFCLFIFESLLKRSNPGPCGMPSPCFHSQTSPGPLLSLKSLTCSLKPWAWGSDLVELPSGNWFFTLGIIWWKENIPAFLKDCLYFYY